MASEDLAARVVRHLVEIAAGRCSITQDDILACRGDQDLTLAEILTGLLYLHQDLVYREELRARDLEELTAADARFGGLLESAPDAMVIADEQGRIVLVNMQAERLFGYQRKEMIDQPVELLIPNRYQAAHKEHRNKYSTEPTARPMGMGRELYGRRSNGEEFPVEISLSPLQMKEQRLVVSAVRDITERRQAELQRSRLFQEQIAREQAEAANRMKDEFLITLSHELRTPLNAILGWSQLMRQRDLSRTQVERAMETIERNSKAQLQLIEDLLDVSRIISGKLRIECRPVHLAEVTAHAIDVIRPAADAKGVSLWVEVQEEMPTVSGDPDRLQQVIWNLLSNAVKFTAKGGWVRISLTNPRDSIHLKVEDSGQGIDHGFLPHIFERFAQADSSSTRTHGGLGLGLAIVRHLVEAHGGAVSVWSAGKGHGARFTVTLPAQDAATYASPELTSTPSRMLQLQGRRLLVVDDRPDELALFATVLRAEGAEVETAGSATAALENLRKNHPDVLISDLAMPQHDGYELIRNVRALPHEQGGAIPAIAVTAYARVEDQEKALASGFQAYISKPVEPRKLVELVARVARKPSESPGRVFGQTAPHST